MVSMHPNVASLRPVAQSGPVARWLWLLAGLVVTMVVVGGITRLTESGLSITQWRPVSGIMPPLSESEWMAEFAHYRQIDQFAAIHSGMTLPEFKHIFYWEYGHRVLGRVVGLVAALGWGWFVARRQVPAGYGLRLLAVPLLIGVQGLLGWLMVASGLKPGMVEVAPGWLAAHLLTALFALSYFVWTALDLGQGRARLTRLGLIAGVVLVGQLAYGALMAGLRAGRVTDQWPLMNGSVWPGPTYAGQGLGHMLTADPAIVHFIHRWWAFAVVAVLVVLARQVKALGARRAAIVIHSAFGTQILLGIATVMSGVGLALAALHQLVGALLVVAVVWGGHILGRAR
jgi:cytochrome c oxidase assembly protein subunit 15